MPENQDTTLPNLSHRWQKRASIWSPLVDFWTLGGLSIFLCLVLHVANFFKDDLPILQMRFVQIFAVFSIFSILCNHPHFLITYRFGYGRGYRFILRNWFPLIFIPLSLIILYGLAFFKFDANISESPYVLKLNDFLAMTGLRFRVGAASKLGSEIMGLSIWFMYFTVGWHYCKQVYGCMMVYAFYDGYKLSPWQRKLFKWSVVSVAFYQFIYMTRTMENYAVSGSIQDSRFQGFYLSAIGLPEWIDKYSVAAMIVLGVSSIVMLVYNYKKAKQLPSINFLVPWLAFYVWWIPLGNLPEYYMAMVPFFHSLQYLPFAFRIENEKIAKNRWYPFQASARILLIVFMGLLAFELIPSILDKKMETDIYQAAYFFLSAFAVFLNIHHFFIDSVVWKLQDDEVKNSLLYVSESRL